MKCSYCKTVEMNIITEIVKRPVPNGAKDMGFVDEITVWHCPQCKQTDAEGIETCSHCKALTISSYAEGAPSMPVRIATSSGDGYTHYSCTNCVTCKKCKLPLKPNDYEMDGMRQHGPSENPYHGFDYSHKSCKDKERQQRQQEQDNHTALHRVKEEEEAREKALKEEKVQQRAKQEKRIQRWSLLFFLSAGVVALLAYFIYSYIQYQRFIVQRGPNLASQIEITGVHTSFGRNRWNKSLEQYVAVNLRNKGPKPIQLITATVYVYNVKGNIVTETWYGQLWAAEDDKHYLAKGQTTKPVFAGTYDIGHYKRRAQGFHVHVNRAQLGLRVGPPQSPFLSSFEKWHSSYADDK